MSYLRLSYLLIALLFFQTAVAFYDSHEELQDIATHVPPHHLDSQAADDGPVVVADKPAAKVKFKGSSNLDFCHHCCHCHGSGVHGLPSNLLQLAAYGNHALPNSLKNPVLPGIFSALYRPPISQT